MTDLVQEYQSARQTKAARRAAKSSRYFTGTVSGVDGAGFATVTTPTAEIACVVPDGLAVSDGDTVRVRVQGCDYRIESLAIAPNDSLEYATDSNQSISSGATAVLGSGSVAWVLDAGNSTDAGSWSLASGVFTCRRAGKFRIAAGATMAGGGSGSWILAWRVNGTVVRQRRVNQGANPGSCWLDRGRRFSEGDTFTIEVTNSTGSSHNVWGGSADAATLTIEARGA